MAFSSPVKNSHCFGSAPCSFAKRPSSSAVSVSGSSVKLTRTTFLFPEKAFCNSSMDAVVCGQPWVQQRKKKCATQILPRKSSRVIVFPLRSVKENGATLPRSTDRRSSLTNGGREQDEQRQRAAKQTPTEMR